MAGGGSIVDDKIAGRIAVDYQEGDGYIDNTFRHDDANPGRTSNARAKLLVLPNRYFDNHNSGHLISRITFNVTMVTGAATGIGEGIARRLAGAVAPHRQAHS